MADISNFIKHSFSEKDLIPANEFIEDMRHLSKKAILLIASVSIIGIIAGFVLYPCFVQHEYYNEWPEYWQVISVGQTSSNMVFSYQVALSGDYLGTGEIVTITNNHHAHPGILLHRQVDGSWDYEPVHPLFDPDNQDAWPVKGINSADFDDDGCPEFITAMDAVFYPPAHIGTTRGAFPGAIYFDPNEPDAEPQPLVWGAWGENLTSTKISNCMPEPVSPEFRSPTNDRIDIMISSMTKYQDKHASRFFILEQPESGFGSINYTYETEDLLGSEPYLNEPFYVKKLYLETELGIKELLWTPDDVEGTNGVTGKATPIHLDDNDNMDMVIAAGYQNGEELVKGRISLYKRINNSSLYEYLFEEIETFWIDDATVGHPTPANLDGNISNGKESLVFAYSSNGSLSYPYTGVLTLAPVDDGYELAGLSVEAGIPYPYVRTYSQLVVLDANQDGYDDAMIFCKHSHTFELNYGDIVLFLNKGEELSTSNHFGFREGEYRILLDDQSLSWGLVTQQIDSDSDPEITVCSMELIPHWCPLTPGAKYAYGLDVIEFLAAEG